jgi:hypothetical protein
MCQQPRSKRLSFPTSHLFLMTNKELQDRFLCLTCSQLHELYYQESEYLELSDAISESLGLKQRLDNPLAKFNYSIEYEEVLYQLIIKYGDMLYRHTDSGGSWRDFSTVADLVKDGNH